MRKVELLAPAGDMEKLKFAIHYGADAVYLAGNAFGLRAYAGNFSNDALAEGVAYAHAHGVRVYVAVNAYPHNEELGGLPEYLRFLDSIDVDALIVADLGVYHLIRELGIRTPLHISTQTSIVNWADAAFWGALPEVERVVLARELSLSEIRTIADRCPNLELEGFVHGAMCMSYSGRCLLSNYLTGRDANRGACAQPCRWKYAIVEEKRPNEYMPIEEDAHGSYIFNAHDMRVIEHLEALIDAGLMSLKIEGRMKSIYYVATVVRAYRKALDAALAGEPLDAYWLDELEKISHRPYTSGFYFGKPEDHAVATEQGGYIQPYDFCGIVLDYDPATGLAMMEQRNKIVIGDEVEFFGPDGEDRTLRIEAIYDEAMEPIDAVPNAQARFYLRLPFAVRAMDMMRRARPARADA